MTFSLSGRDATLFHADPVSGAVTASASFRPRPTYGLLATATDGAGAGRALRVTRKVEVFMADEFSAPGFAPGAANPEKVEVAEDSPVGSVVAR